MRILRAIIFAVGLVTGSSVQAQDVLSDNELFASYCLAYLSDAYRDIKPILDKSDQQCRNFPGTPTPCAELSRMARDGEADLLHRLDRLRLYLLARGLLTARTDVPAMVGLAVATNRGRADYQSCKEQLTKLGSAATPGNPPECAKRCDDLSRIPM
jgi:hypothetical protein